MVHKERLNKKPSKEEYAKMINQFQIMDLSLAQICKAIEQGKTIRPGIFFDKIEKRNWQFQQLLFIDFDNGQTVNSTLKKCNELGLEPSIVYPTFSYNFENQKHRLVFCLDEPVCNIETLDLVYNKLYQLFNPDKGALKPTQMFLGSNKGIFLIDNRSRVSVQQILDISVVPNKVEQLSL